MEHLDPVIRGSPGCVCVFPQLWIPERLTPPMEDVQRGSGASGEASPEEEKANGVTGSSSQGEQSLSTNKDSEEETSGWGKGLWGRV